MSTTPEHERPSTRWKHSRTYPNGRRVADLSSIPPTPDSTCGRLCTPERIVPGLRRLARTSPGQQRLLEAEALAHFALSAGATEARLVTPVALALSEGHALLLPQGLRKDLRVVALQELAHEQRYGSDVVEFVQEDIGFEPATLRCEIAVVPPARPPTLPDVGRYVVAEANASGTLFGDHGKLCEYSDALFRGHRADELIHNEIALRVNQQVMTQSSGESLQSYLDALRGALVSSAEPSTTWVREVIRRLGHRGEDLDTLVSEVIDDIANAEAVVVSCGALFRSLHAQLSEAVWQQFTRSLPERLRPSFC